MRKKISQSEKGITLVEILISFAIFAILFAIVVFGFYDFKKIQSLRIAANKLADTLREAQNYTMSGKTYGNDFPIGGYGLHIDINDSTEKNRYIIFADHVAPISGACQGVANERYDNDDDFASRCAGDLEIISFVLPNKVEIAKIEVYNGLVLQASPNYLDVTFQPPRPVIYTGWLDNVNQRDPNNPVCTYPDRNAYIYLKQTEKKMCRLVSIIGSSSQIKNEKVNCP